MLFIPGVCITAESVLKPAIKQIHLAENCPIASIDYISCSALIADILIAQTHKHMLVCSYSNERSTRTQHQYKNLFKFIDVNQNDWERSAVCCCWWSAHRLRCGVFYVSTAMICILWWSRRLLAVGTHWFIRHRLPHILAVHAAANRAVLIRQINSTAEYIIFFLDFGSTWNSGSRSVSVSSRNWCGFCLFVVSYHSVSHCYSKLQFFDRIQSKKKNKSNQKNKLFSFLNF